MQQYCQNCSDINIRIHQSLRQQWQEIHDEKEFFSQVTPAAETQQEQIGWGDFKSRPKFNIKYVTKFHKLQIESY